MSENDSLKSLISIVDSMLSDIENRVNMESIGEKYSELKTQTENEIKTLSNSPTNQYVEAIYLPALQEFKLCLKAPKGTNHPGKLYDALLDGVGILKWYADQADET